jgi:hypothetical protein
MSEHSESSQQLIGRHSQMKITQSLEVKDSLESPKFNSIKR